MAHFRRVCILLTGLTTCARGTFLCCRMCAVVYEAKAGLKMCAPLIKTKSKYRNWRGQRYLRCRWLANQNVPGNNGRGACSVFRIAFTPPWRHSATTPPLKRWAPARLQIGLSATTFTTTAPARSWMAFGFIRASANHAPCPAPPWPRDTSFLKKTITTFI